MLSYVIYRSDSVVHPKSAACGSIFLSARPKNRRLKITGYLHHEDGKFVQYLEGPAVAIDQVLADIWRDGRHQSKKVIFRGQTTRRLFPDWDMAFTHKEITAFQIWAKGRGGRNTIANASPQQLLCFFRETCDFFPGALAEAA